MNTRQRRSHVPSGIGLLLAGALIFLGSGQPMVTVHGPALTEAVLGGLGLGLDSPGHSGIGQNTQTALRGAAVVLVVLGVLFLCTHTRVVGHVWRLLALLTLAVPVYVAITLWRFVADPVGYLEPENPDASTRLVTGALKLVGKADLYEVTAGRGLYLIATGAALALIAVLIPGLGTESTGNRLYGVPHRQPEAMPGPGWYPNPANAQTLDYWDGQRWTGDRTSVVITPTRGSGAN